MLSQIVKISAVIALCYAAETPGVYSQAQLDSAEKDTHYSQPIIDNPAYDPSLYTSFVPQDAVQQYVNHYGGPYPPHPQAYYGSNPDSSFAVQTGYEGYLVPSFPAIASEIAPGFSSFAKIAPAGYGFVKSALPVIGKVLFAVIVKLAIVAASALGVVATGGLITALVCTFTPVCKLTFPGLPFVKLRESAKQITSALESEITQERVKRAAEFVKIALDKYNAMQQGSGTAASKPQTTQEVAANKKN